MVTMNFQTKQHYFKNQMNKKSKKTLEEVKIGSHKFKNF